MEIYILKYVYRHRVELCCVAMCCTKRCSRGNKPHDIMPHNASSLDHGRAYTSGIEYSVNRDNE